MLKINKTIPPHAGEKIHYAGTTIENAAQAMILIHGRGAAAQSMLAMTDLFDSQDIIYIMPQAHNLTWYPYRFIEKRETNEPGISSGLTLIHTLVKSVNDAGIPDEKIYFLGFSQGACLVADYAARYPSRYGGVFVLSGGLIGDTIRSGEFSGDLKNTPVFFGCSDSDFHIPAERVDESAYIFEQLNADVTKSIYPDMGHTINQNEIDFIKKVLLQNQKFWVSSNPL